MVMSHLTDDISGWAPFRIIYSVTHGRLRLKSDQHNTHIHSVASPRSFSLLHSTLLYLIIPTFIGMNGK